MAIFNSYVKLPEGSFCHFYFCNYLCICWYRFNLYHAKMNFQKNGNDLGMGKLCTLKTGRSEVESCSSAASDVSRLILHCLQNWLWASLWANSFWQLRSGRQVLGYSRLTHQHHHFPGANSAATVRSGTLELPLFHVRNTIQTTTRWCPRQPCLLGFAAWWSKFSSSILMPFSKPGPNDQVNLVLFPVTSELGHHRGPGRGSLRWKRRNWRTPPPDLPMNTTSRCDGWMRKHDMLHVDGWL